MSNRNPWPKNRQTCVSGRSAIRIKYRRSDLVASTPRRLSRIDCVGPCRHGWVSAVDVGRGEDRCHKCRRV